MRLRRGYFLFSYHRTTCLYTDKRYIFGTMGAFLHHTHADIHLSITISSFGRYEKKNRRPDHVVVFKVVPSEMCTRLYEQCAATRVLPSLCCVRRFKNIKNICQRPFSCNFPLVCDGVVLMLMPSRPASLIRPFDGGGIVVRCTTGTNIWPTQAS